jgi:hypothetical protein
VAGVPSTGGLYRRAQVSVALVRAIPFSQRWQMAGMAARIGAHTSHLPSLDAGTMPAEADA